MFWFNSFRFFYIYFYVFLFYLFFSFFYFILFCVGLYLLLKYFEVQNCSRSVLLDAHSSVVVVVALDSPAYEDISGTFCWHIVCELHRYTHKIHNTKHHLHISGLFYHFSYFSSSAAFFSIIFSFSLFSLLISFFLF